MYDFKKIDHKIQGVAPFGALSLSPNKKFATSVEALSVLAPKGYQEFIYDIIDCLVSYYPKSLYWDFDVLVAELSQLSSDELVVTKKYLCLILERYSQWFEYHHDFIYGFDWCRYRSKFETESLNPYNLDFLKYLEMRSQEIKSDPKSLTTHNFLRSKEQERLLLMNLSEKNYIPVHSWNSEFKFCDHKISFECKRIQFAKKLGGEV